MVERFKETGQPVFKSLSALSRGILTRKNNTLECGCFEHRTQFRPIHSASQLSIYGAVSSWCEEFGQRPNEREMTSERFTTKENEQILKEVKPQEEKILVQTPRSDDPVAGNRLRERLQNFETLEKSIQFTKVCEDASFWKKSLYGNVLQNRCRRG